MGCKFDFGKCLVLLGPATDLVIADCCIKSTFHYMSQSEKYFVVYNKRKQHFKVTICLIFSQLMRPPLTEIFHLCNLLQMPNSHRIVDIKFLDNFLYSCKCISFIDPLVWSLSASSGLPLCSSSSRLSSPLQNFLNHHWALDVY